MNTEPLILPAVILLVLTSFLVLHVNNWRIQIIGLAIQYIGVFTLVYSVWPLALSVTKIVTGWIASAVLGLSLLNAPEIQNVHPRLVNAFTTQRSADKKPNVSIFLFQFLSTILVLLIIFSTSTYLQEWFPTLKIELLWGAMTLLSLGLMQIGFHATPFRTSLGLLTALSGFEILYAGLETSTLVAGLLSVVNFGIALVGAYLLIATQIEVEG